MIGTCRPGRVTPRVVTRKEGAPRHPRIAVLGSHGDFTAQAVRTLCESGVPPVALLTGAHPASESHGPIPIEVRSSATEVAAAHGVELVRARDPNHADAIAALERIEPDLLLLACLPHVVGRAARETARLAALNLHPSALPRFRGPDPVFWQLRAGVARAAATVHVATGALDSGPVVDQRWIEVPPGIGAAALTAALVRAGVLALVEMLPEVDRRIRDAVPQDESAATRQPRPRAEDYRLDTSWSAERAYRFIEGTRGPATTFRIRGDEGEIEIERAVGFEPASRTRPAVRVPGGIVAIRFAQGMLRAVPAQPARS